MIQPQEAVEVKKEPELVTVNLEPVSHVDSQATSGDEPPQTTASATDGDGDGERVDSAPEAQSPTALPHQFFVCL